MAAPIITTRAEAARVLAASLLGDGTDRWRHSAGVAERAGALAVRLGLDEDLLVAAAWLHDVGYAAPLIETGFHPIDGARHLTREGWPARVAGLVAHHSGARFVAEVRGLAAELSEFPDERSIVADVLTYADQTVGPRGDRVDPEARYAEMLLRHGPCSFNALADPGRRPHLRAVAARVEALLAATYSERRKVVSASR
ncbi:HD domain-containing protein [Actinoplanes sp. NPDC023714]|uniref:HD domain-containing protein n=1 Tax=Actinoplanes sp. NPDC023714 TaxID=3154322 RepID=UPI0033EA83A2